MDLEGRIRVWRKFYVGAAVGYYVANTGKGERSGFPSTDQIFHPSQTPGPSQQSRFLRGGGFLEYDWRDNPRGPRIDGHYARHLRYSDQQLDLHSFHRLEVGAEQYIPYWNRTRVIALQARAVGAWARDSQTVPFYLQPTLGGNDRLRGFERYRFYDQSAFHAAVDTAGTCFPTCTLRCSSKRARWRQRSRNSTFTNWNTLAASASALRFRTPSSCVWTMP